MPCGVSRQLLGRASGEEKEKEMLNRAITSYQEAQGEADAYLRAGELRKAMAALLLSRQSLMICLWILKRDFDFPAVG